MLYRSAAIDSGYSAIFLQRIFFPWAPALSIHWSHCKSIYVCSIGGCKPFWTKYMWYVFLKLNVVIYLFTVWSITDMWYVFLYWTLWSTYLLYEVYVICIIYGGKYMWYVFFFNWTSLWLTYLLHINVYSGLTAPVSTLYIDTFLR